MIGILVACLLASVGLYGMMMFVQHQVRGMCRTLYHLHPPKPRWWQYFKLWDPPA